MQKNTIKEKYLKERKGKGMKNILKEIKEQCTNVNYYEGKSYIKEDNHILAVKLCETSLYKDYVVYENKNCLSIGMGKYIDITVYPNKIILDFQGREEAYEIDNVNKELKRIFKEIPIERWRAYGIVNFALAYNTNNLPLDKEEDCLMKIFIPKIEFEIRKNEILFRAIEFSDFQKLNRNIEDIKNSDKDEKYLQFIKSKEKINPQDYIKENGDEYKRNVAKAVEEIKNRKYNKVIISRKININEKLDMLSSYILGRKDNNPARSYILSLDGEEIIGYSPETVVEVSKDGIVSTFPLAGTRAIADNNEETARLKEELLADSKEIAEHAISVKLAYEELEKVCKKETIVVSDFMDVLERGTVQHLASRLRGKLKEELTEWDALKALFPAVTASGIPKKEAIDAICRIEKEPRALYSGSVFTYTNEGELDAALVLRSIYQNKDATWLRAGAGIVELSLPDRELEETCEKLNSVINQLVKL